MLNCREFKSTYSVCHLCVSSYWAQFLNFVMIECHNGFRVSGFY